MWQCVDYPQVTVEMFLSELAALAASPFDAPFTLASSASVKPAMADTTTTGRSAWRSADDARAFLESGSAFH